MTKLPFQFFKKNVLTTFHFKKHVRDAIRSLFQVETVNGKTTDIPWSRIHKDLSKHDGFDVTDTAWGNVRTNFLDLSAGQKHYTSLVYWLYREHDNIIDRERFNAEAARLIPIVFGRSIEELEEHYLKKEKFTNNSVKCSPRNSEHQPVLWCPSFDSKSGNWLNPYGGDGIRFVGRVSEIDALNDFFTRNEKFLLWGLSGASGTGKTRLVSYWLTQLADTETNSMNLGFLTDTQFDWNNWFPSKPTVIVIDYLHRFGASFTSLFERISALDAEGMLDEPVRVVLLDHVLPKNLMDVFTDIRLSTPSFSGAIADVRERYFFSSKPLSLHVDENTRDFLEEIMGEVFTRRSVRTVTPEEIASALDSLAEIPGAWNPLFASLLARSIVDGHDGKFSDRRDITKYYLNTSNRLPWHSKDFLEGSLGDYAGCIVAAATALRGCQYHDLIEHLPENISGDPDTVEKLIATCNWITSNSSKYDLIPFEPDILGETFFLLVLDRINNSPEKMALLEQMLCSQERKNLAEAYGIEFFGFLTRLLRNLSHEVNNFDKNVETIISFLTRGKFLNNSFVGLAKTMVTIDLLEDFPRDRASFDQEKLIRSIDPNDLLIEQGDRLKFGAFFRILYLLEHAENLPIQDIVLEQVLIKMATACRQYDHNGTELSDPVFLAIESASTKCLKILFQNGWKIDQVYGENGVSALLHAARKGDPKIVQCLLQFNPSLELASLDDGSTALFQAAISGSEETVDLLIQERANLDHASKGRGLFPGGTPLLAAVQLNFASIVSKLLENGANPNVGDAVIGLTPLHVATADNNLKLLNLLISGGADPNIQRRDDGWISLHEACHRGFGESVSILLKAGSKAQSATKIELWTPLMLACMKGHSDVALTLVSSFKQRKFPFRRSAINLAALNATDDQGSTALMHACKRGHSNCVSLLLDSGADPNTTSNSDGWSPLMSASSIGNEKIVASLISAGADVNFSSDPDFLTSMMLACENGHLGTVKLLFSKTLNLEIAKISGATALMIASQWGHHKIVEFLLLQHANVNAEAINDGGWTSLTVAAMNGHRSIVLALLDAGADANSGETGDGNYPVYTALLNGHVGTAAILLQRGATIFSSTLSDNANQIMQHTLEEDSFDHSAVLETIPFKEINVICQLTCGVDYVALLDQTLQSNVLSQKESAQLLNSCFHNSIRCGAKSAVKRILQHMQDAQSDTSEVISFGLGLTCHHQKDELTDFFLKKGADPNKEFAEDHTPLSAACIHGTQKIVKQLVIAGADVNQQSSISGRTALMDAVISCDEEKIRFLIMKGAKVSLKSTDKQGATALVIACSIKGISTKLVRDLLDAGASINDATADAGWTPLMAATANGNSKLVRFLLNNGADPSMKTYDDAKTAPEIASEKGFAEIIRAFRYSYLHW